MNEVEFYLLDLKSKFDKIDKSKYFLSYSGGKDSHFLYWFIKDYLKDNEIEIVGVNTFFEHDEIIKRIYKNCDTVLVPRYKPNEIKKRFGIPCFTKVQDEFIDRYQKGSRSQSTLERVLGFEQFGGQHSRFQLSKSAREFALNPNGHKVSTKCCKYLKKLPSKDYMKATGKKAILGVRGNESVQRKAKYKSCFQKNGNFTPIHDLSNELLEKIYKEKDIEIPNIYNYVDRTGCVGCPYGTNVARQDTIKELELVNDNKRRFIIDYFKESYEVRGIDYKRFIPLILQDPYALNKKNTPKH